MMTDRRVVTADELACAIVVVCRMSDDDFFDAAVKIGLDPWAGRVGGRRARDEI